MLQTWVIVLTSTAWVGLLFAIAFHGDRRADRGRAMKGRGTIYALSLGVYATSWTYYGSVGEATTSGLAFLPIYLGPTLMLGLGYPVMRRIIRISKRYKITSLADFVAARYGKSAVLGGFVAAVAVIGVVPYIALQLKAVSETFEETRLQPAAMFRAEMAPPNLASDTALYLALLLAAFAIFFGTRHLDTSERHSGIVAAISFEAVVKLVIFLTVGVYATFVLFHGFGDLFAKAHADPRASALFTLGRPAYGAWIWETLLSMSAIVFLPRQWQMSVVENVEERHLLRAAWLFPLYLLALTVFVLPIALAGLLRLGDNTAAPDTFVLALPLSGGQEALTVLAFLGGLSAATGMIIVETVALSTMVSNSLVLPILLRSRSRLVQRPDLSHLVLGIRRAAIVAIVLLGYAYFRLAGQTSDLVSIGLVSFAAVAQFAPGVIGGLYWKGGSRDGVLAGLVGGFVVWAYTLVLPNLSSSGWPPQSFFTRGPFGNGWLRPDALFGLSGMDVISNAMFWSMAVNIGCYVGVSLARSPSAQTAVQADLFVDVLRSERRPSAPRGRAPIRALQDVTKQYLGPARAAKAWRAFDAGGANGGGVAGGGSVGSLAGAAMATSGGSAADGLERPVPAGDARPELVDYVETLLGGAMGTASARLVLESVVEEEPIPVDTMLEILDEASQVAALEERHRLARELHDSVSQTLFSITLRTRALELAVKRFGGDPGGALATGLAELRELTRDSLTEMRALIFQLRPEALHEEGLVAAIDKHVAAVASRERLDICVRAPVTRLPLDERSERELFRIVQEALNNCVKHASPQHVVIDFLQSDTEPGSLVVEIRDDGVGFGPDEARPGHLGLSTMRERAAQLGADFTLASSPGRTVVKVTLPGVFDPPQQAPSPLERR